MQIRKCKHLYSRSVTWIPASLHPRCVMWWENCLTSARADASPCLKSRMLWAGTVQKHYVTNLQTYLSLTLHLAWSYSAFLICRMISLSWQCTCNTLFYSCLLFKRLFSNLYMLLKFFIVILSFRCVFRGVLIDLKLFYPAVFIDSLKWTAHGRYWFSFVVAFKWLKRQLI